MSRCHDVIVTFLTQCYETPQAGSDWARLWLPVLIDGTADGDSPQPLWRYLPLYSARHHYKVCKALEWGVLGIRERHGVISSPPKLGGVRGGLNRRYFCARTLPLNRGMVSPALVQTTPPVRAPLLTQEGKRLLNSRSLCWKSAEIEGRNLENRKKVRNFAVLKVKSEKVKSEGSSKGANGLFSHLLPLTSHL